MEPKKKRRLIEREFGVPIAGEVLDPSRWAQTALKKLPAEGRLDVDAVFGRHAPLVLDLGCGNGRFLIGSAVWRPDHDHFGIDVLPVVIRYATRRGNQRGLTNLRFAVCDAETFLLRSFPPGSGRARTDLGAEDALRLAESLPLPVFDADRRLRELDELERRGHDGG